VTGWDRDTESLVEGVPEGQRSIGPPRLLAYQVLDVAVHGIDGVRGAGDGDEGSSEVMEDRVGVDGFTRTR